MNKVWISSFDLMGFKEKYCIKHLGITSILNKLFPFSEALKQGCPKYGLWTEPGPPQIPIQPVG